MWEVNFLKKLSILQCVGLAINPMVFKKPHLQKNIMDYGKALT